MVGSGDRLSYIFTQKLAFPVFIVAEWSLENPEYNETNKLFFNLLAA
jgi:hypothetical protein